MLLREYEFIAFVDLKSGRKGKRDGYGGELD